MWNIDWSMCKYQTFVTKRYGQYVDQTFVANMGQAP